ncbi:MAG: hypothetical protein AAGB14_04765 [Verrucomicrobiota bacterium]
MSHHFRIFLLISPVVCPLLGLLVGALFSCFGPRIYEASTVLQIRPITSAPSLVHPTKLEITKATKTLDIVIDDLSLTTRWGLHRDVARRRLEQSIQARNISGTELTEIRAFSSSPEEARLLVEGTSEAYRQRLTKLETQRSQQAIDELRDAVRHQEEVVAEKRKTLTSIIRQGVLDGRFQGAPVVVAYTELRKQRSLIEAHLDSTLKLDNERLMAFAAKLQLPENIIRSRYPQYLEAKRQLDALKLAGLGDRHPNIKQQQKVIEGMRRDLDEGVIALRETLEAQLELNTEQLERMEITFAKDKPTPSGQAAKSTGERVFDDARTEFESAQRLLEQLKVKLVSEEMSHRMVASPVIVHAEPHTPDSPSFPKLRTHLGIGLLSGLAAGFIIPLLIRSLPTCRET